MACRYDDGDCDGRESNLQDYKNPRDNELFYPSIDFTNILLETKLKLHNRWREWVPHYPFMISKSVMSELQMKIARKGLLRSGRILAVFVRFADRRLRRRLHGHYRANFYHF